MTTRKRSAGRFFPLGATLEPEGVNFALYSKHATAVSLLLFDREDGEPTDVIPLENRTRFVFHAFVEGIRAGQVYAYRVEGPWDPNNGHRFDGSKVLLDPYARAIAGSPLKGIVVDDAFDWQGDRPPSVPFEKLVVYETHLKGFTAHESSGASLPGTYLGFVDRIPHLVELGVNAVELLPIHAKMVGGFLTDKGLTNYWGYDTIGFFAPEPTFRAGARPGSEVLELKTLVRALHRAGIEVILDVVYNHTAEGNHEGPTVSFRGIDNATYYALTGGPYEPRKYYENWTGTGNSLNVADPHVMRFVMDSLRYWVEVMHVDGFRFDLASVLGRQDGRFQRAASFFDVVSQDPVLSRAKLIAEPWDLGAYEVGNFPVDWSEWNGRFRDCVRKFEKGDSGQVRELGYRLTGSSDLYGDDGRSAYNTINFVTCHDGFTLNDLVSYDRKHNEANGEDNRDGTDDNASWNSGAEGMTNDPTIAALRRQRAKNLICHLFFAAGTPMLLGGDEMLRTQRGNNNAYCQDNELSWIDWTLKGENEDVFEFTKKAIAFRRRYPVLERRSFFSGRDVNQDQRPDIKWYGFTLDEPEWSNPELRTIAYQLDGAESDVDAGSYLVFVILNASWNPHEVLVPDPGPERRWHRVVDTARAAPDDFLAEGSEVRLDPADRYTAGPRSTVVLLAVAR